MSHDEFPLTPSSHEDLRVRAAAIADALWKLPNAADPVGNTGGGSRHRAIPADLQKQFIDLRAELFQRGIYDPVLVRFDTASAPQATTTEVAEQLKIVASSVGR